MAERFFILTPTPTDRTVTVDGCGTPSIYLDAFGMEMKWGQRNPLPAIGERIYVDMNQLGYASVVGYLESHGWLGLMVKFENPPEWFHKQVARHDASKPKWMREGIGCIFSAEFRKEK